MKNVIRLKSLYKEGRERPLEMKAEIEIPKISP